MAEPAGRASPSWRIESAARTDVGRVRDHNEDSYCARQLHGLWAVADGMGGLEGGEWASARLAASLGEVELGGDFDRCCDRIAEAIREANRAIYAEGQRRGRPMGSTIVALLVRDGRYGVLWAGDSRAYLRRGGEMRQLSRDHGPVQEMIDRGLLSPEEAIGHPLSHILSRAIGVDEEVEIDRAGGEIRSGDMFLLCSDGLHDVVEQGEIARRLAGGAPDCVADALVELALAHGAPDNVTVIVVRATETSEPPAPAG